MGEDGYRAARRTVLNAHYTDPALVSVMWDHLSDLGFTGGRVLEPGSGLGTFLSKAPDTAEMIGVELDPATAQISQALHPHAQIINASFADVHHLKDLDAAIGNVPFAKVALYDPKFNRAGHSIHNHFLLKSLTMMRPGGVMVALTSRYTLDAQDRAARRELHELADLVAGVRLPSGAHKAHAGTEAVTDLLVFRRRDPDAEVPQEPAWIRSVPAWVNQVDGSYVVMDDYSSDDDPVWVNAGFTNGDLTTLGRPRVGHGMYNATNLLIDPTPGQPLAEQLRAALTTAAAQTGLRWTPAPAAARSKPAGPSEPPTPQQWDGHLIWHQESSAFYAASQGQWEPVKVAKTHAPEMRQLLNLRDHVVELRELQVSPTSSDIAIEEHAADTRQIYHLYQNKYGPLGRYKEHLTGRFDPDSGEPIIRKTVPATIRRFTQDPAAALVMAAEVYDPSTDTAEIADMLKGRVISHAEPVTRTDDPHEAVILSLNTVGRLDAAHIAALMDCSEQEATDRVLAGQLAFRDPEDPERLIHAPEYLSGQVRVKLKQAEAVASTDPRFEVNVAALHQAVPEDIGMDEIKANLGAVWIDTQTHEDFLREILDDRFLRVRHPGGNYWEVDGRDYGPLAQNQWGTRRKPATKLAQALLEQRSIQVFDTDWEDRRILNIEETAAANEKAQALQERFSEWVWEEPERARRLHASYNEKMNGLALRDFEADGQRLSFPGLADHFEPRPHQRAVVARMLAQESTGIFQVVGAGKSAEMSMGCMELKRLGLAKKPLVVVPDHMLRQFAGEWLDIYPGATLLAADGDDMTPKARPGFIAKAATHDWDAIILTHSAFHKLPVRKQTEVDYANRQLDKLRDWLDKAVGTTEKRLQRTLATREERLKALLDQDRDPSITFEALGADYVCYDEAHLAKNLSTISNIPDAGKKGSQLASDLDMKLGYLRSQGRSHVAALATGTPIANSITEAHVMLRYLAPQLLEANGTAEFDAWAATFGEVVTALEMGVEGGSNYRPKARLAKFNNVPELLVMIHSVADVRTAEDLNLPTPQLRQRDSDQQRLPQIITCPPSEATEQYLASLVERADKVRKGDVDVRTDNMLAICTDGRKAALDLRLVDPAMSPGEEPKVVHIATKVAEIHHQYKDHRYEGSDTPGALQVIFCDQGTPGPDKAWSAYDAIKAELVERGVPAEKIRFVHEADTNLDKAMLFAAARSGDVAVLLGSTQKMGVGTNVQKRLVALHHADAPWRPADVQQRDGRICRQGNSHAEVGIYTYVSEKTFDAFMWSTIERKAKFIDQIMKNKLDVREMEELAGEAMTFGEIKALASGDPLVLEKANADTELAKLERLERAWKRNHTNLRGIIRDNTRRLEVIAERLPQAHTAAEQITAHEEEWEGNVAGKRFTDQNEAGKAIKATFLDAHETYRDWLSGDIDLGQLLHLNGHSITGRLVPGGQSSGTAMKLWVTEAPFVSAVHQFRKILGHPKSVATTANKLIRDLERLPAQLAEEQSRLRRDVSNAQESLGGVFKHAEKLEAAQERVAELEKLMTAEQDQPAATPAAPADDPLRDTVAPSSKPATVVQRVG